MSSSIKDEHIIKNKWKYKMFQRRNPNKRKEKTKKKKEIKQISYRIYPRKWCLAKTFLQKNQDGKVQRE